MTTRLVFLSYGRLTGQIKKILPQYPSLKFDILNVNLDRVLDTILNYEAGEDDCVFIASGANAQTAAEQVHQPLVEIQSTGYDFLTALSAASQHNKEAVAVVTFKEPLPYLSTVKHLFRIKCIERQYRNKEDLNKLMHKLQESQVYDVIGSSMVCEAAEQNNLRGHMLWTEPAIRYAIDNAIHIANIKKATLSDAQRMQTIMDFTHEGIVVTDPVGKIEFFNAKAEKITGISSRHALGRNITEVIETTRLDEVIKERKMELNQIQEIGNSKILTNRVPIVIKNEVIGAVATFQHIDMVQKAEEKIRHALYSKGFIAQTHFRDIISKSPRMEVVKKEAMLYAASESTILVKGESGTGKELLAQSIHNKSPRENKPFVAVNCAALPDALLESELFGYEDGAFTGAKKGGKRGLFEMAHTGTLFLDEIGEMPLSIQARLLRVLEQREIMRVGGQMIVKVDVRIIAATNKDLWSMVQERSFREDLYYRLNVLELRLPPLRERKEDIPLLACHFLADNRKDLTAKELHQIAHSPALLEYDWPGNIRELKNIMERFSVLYEEGGNGLQIINDVMFLSKTSIIHTQHKNDLRAVLSECGGNKSRAAEALGISRTTLWRKLKEYGSEE